MSLPSPMSGSMAHCCRGLKLCPARCRRRGCHRDLSQACSLSCANSELWVAAMYCSHERRRRYQGGRSSVPNRSTESATAWTATRSERASRLSIFAAGHRMRASRNHCAPGSAAMRLADALGTTAQTGGRQGALFAVAGTAKQTLAKDIRYARQHDDQFVAHSSTILAVMSMQMAEAINVYSTAADPLVSATKRRNSPPAPRRFIVSLSIDRIVATEPKARL